MAKKQLPKAQKDEAKKQAKAKKLANKKAKKEAKANAKKSKAQVKAQRVAAANKARKVMIDNAIAKHEAKQKAKAKAKAAKLAKQRAKKEAKAKRVAAANKARKALIDNAIAKYEAKKKKISKAHKQNISTAKKEFRQRGYIPHKNVTAVRQMSGIILWLAIATLVFSTIFVSIAISYILCLPGLDQYAGEVCIDLFFSLGIVGTVAIAALCLAIFLTLAKDKKLRGVPFWSIIVIWTFAVFVMVLRFLNILISTNVIGHMTESGRIACYIIALLGPIFFVIFGALLFVKVCHLYPETYDVVGTRRVKK